MLLGGGGGGADSEWLKKLRPFVHMVLHTTVTAMCVCVEHRYSLFADLEDLFLALCFERCTFGRDRNAEIGEKRHLSPSFASHQKRHSVVLAKEAFAGTLHCGNRFFLPLLLFPSPLIVALPTEDHLLSSYPCVTFRTFLKSVSQFHTS